MVPIGCPETSVNNYHTTPRNTPEDRRSHQHRDGSLKSRSGLCIYDPQRHWVAQDLGSPTSPAHNNFGPLGGYNHNTQVNNRPMCFFIYNNFFLQVSVILPSSGGIYYKMWIVLKVIDCVSKSLVQRLSLKMVE
jgi:hypothetical protein